MRAGRRLRRTSRLSRRAGFTLIELIVAMAIFSIVLFSAMLALNMTFSVGLRNRRRSEAQEDISAALEQITRQLRQVNSANLTVPAAASSNSIQPARTGVAILTFTDINGNVVSYSAAVPTDATEIIPAVGGVLNYQIMATSGAAPAQPMTGQNVTSFTAERPSWSNNVVIITLQSQQMNASGTKTSPLTVMSMVTLRQ